jgi:hypothetical protein
MLEVGPPRILHGRALSDAAAEFKVGHFFRDRRLSFGTYLDCCAR